MGGVTRRPLHHRRQFRKAKKIKVTAPEDLSQAGFVASQSYTGRPSNRDHQVGLCAADKESDIRVRALVTASEPSSIAAPDRHGAERGERNRRRSHADVEAPQSVSRIETVEAFIIETLRPQPRDPSRPEV